MAIKINKNAKFSDDSFLERFKRQIKIPGWGEREQKNIFDKKILVLGEGILGEMALTGLASFGARNLFYMDYQGKAHVKSYFSHVGGNGTRLERIVRTTAKINPYARIFGYATPFTRFYLALEDFVPDIIIDTTNDLESKEAILDFLEKNIKVKFISGISNPIACAVSFYDLSNQNYEDILHPKIEIEKYHQGGFTSTVAAGLIIEEFRKSIFHLDKGDENSAETVYFNLFSHSRNSPALDFNTGNYNVETRILLAGAGGIGNYAGLALAQEGFKHISILDMDIVEDTNLNRQMLFYDSVGQEKSASLARMLSRAYNISPRVLRGELNKSSEELFAKNQYDLILGCFDNVNARVFLNDFAVKYKIPYFDGATTYESGQITSYVPGKSFCVRCKRGIAFEEVIVDNSCDNSLPSVISPNMIIGASMIGEAMNFLSGAYENIRFVYNTKKEMKIKSYSDDINLGHHECFQR